MYQTRSLPPAPTSLCTTHNSAKADHLQLIKEFVGVFSPSFLLSSPPPPLLPKKEENYPRRWRCSQTIILTYSNNRNLQNSNHYSRAPGGINQSYRFNSILNIDEMCSGSLTLAWQGQGNRGGGGRVEEQLPEERHLGFKLVAVQPGRE